MLKNFIKPILVGLLIGMAVCLIVLLLLAAVAAAVDIPAAVVVPLATVATAISAFVGGFAAAKLSGRNGWLIGVLSAILLFVSSLAAGIGFFRQMDVGFLFVKMAVMLACGMVGGMFAVNSGKRKKR